MGKPAIVEHGRIVTLLSQLKNRKVLRVAIAYVVVVWIAMQVGEVTFEALQLPDWTLTLLVAVSLLGFPIAVVLAWAYEITPEGIVRDIDGNIDNRTVIYEQPDSDTSMDIAVAEPSIAVLPFEDMSSNRDQGYFCEGVAEEILCALCEVDGLHVAARVASFQFGSRSADVLEIGKLLNVSVVLEGSVRKAGDKIRTTVQLINTQDGYQFWAGQYNHDMKDIFDIQERIARAIVTTMKLSFTEGELLRPKTQNTEAYDLYLQGNRYFGRLDMHNILPARQFLQRAVELDPAYGLAWSKLALTYSFEYLNAKPDAGKRYEARRISIKALQLAPEIPESHIARGIAHTICQEYHEADLEFETAIGLKPDMFGAWLAFARSKNYEGDIPRAIELFQKASEIRPEDYQSVLLQVSLYDKTGNSKAAKEKAKEGLQRVREFLALSPDENRAWNLGAIALQTLGKHAEAEKWMNTSINNSPRNSILTYNAACFHALAGNIENSLDHLKQAADSDCLNLNWLEQDADLDAVRDHPRFKEIIAQFRGEAGLSQAKAKPMPARNRAIL